MTVSTMFSVQGAFCMLECPECERHAGPSSLWGTPSEDLGQLSLHTFLPHQTCCRQEHLKEGAHDHPG